jgi:CRP-like cAMP-binding protein
MNTKAEDLSGDRFNEIAFLADCTAEQQRALASFCRVCRFRSYASLQQEGQPSRGVYFVLQGEVLLQKEVRPGAEPARLSIVRRGEMFGFGEIMLRTCYTTALALTPVEVVVVTVEDFLRYFLALPKLRDRLLRALSEITRILIHQNVAGDGLHELAFYLHHLCRDSGKKVGRRIHIQTPVRQPEVASVLNLSREHVTRLFARLRQQGVVNFNRGFPVVDAAWLDHMTRDRDLADSLQYRDVPRPAAHQ